MGKGRVGGEGRQLVTASRCFLLQRLSSGVESSLSRGSGCTASGLPVSLFTIKDTMQGRRKLKATGRLRELEIFISSFELFTLPIPFINAMVKSWQHFGGPGPDTSCLFSL